ncbi:MAG: UPF0147 family protein, partial [Candidatus Methanomethylophilaceae archaeon]|nr:UPF0147 family protein [Candidatus Methanomethylophilaceae archaeon]
MTVLSCTSQGSRANFSAPERSGPETSWTSSTRSPLSCRNSSRSDTMASIEQRIKMTANELEGRLANDNGVPRNIRKGAADAVNHLMDTSKAT